MADRAPAFGDRLRRDLKAAMLARQSDETRVLRALIAAIDNAQAVPVAQARYVSRAFGDATGEVARRALSDDDLDALLRHGQPERAQSLRDEAALVERYRAG